jgi:hypothetical protein
MTITAAQLYFVLDNEFTLDELRDIAEHGAKIGVPGFTYSSDMRNLWDKHEDVITDYLDGYCDDTFGQSSLSYIAEQLSFDDKFWTMQQVIEYACWMYLELRANEIVNTVEGNW